MSSFYYSEVLVSVFVPGQDICLSGQVSALQISREYVSTAQLSQASSKCWDGKRNPFTLYTSPLPQQAPHNVTLRVPSLPSQTSQGSTTSMNVDNSFCRCLLCSTSTWLSLWCVSKDIIKIQFCGICMLLDICTANTEKRNLFDHSLTVYNSSPLDKMLFSSAI